MRQINHVEIKLKLQQPQRERGMEGGCLEYTVLLRWYARFKARFLQLLKQERFGRVEAIGHMTVELMRHWVNGDEADA